MSSRSKGEDRIEIEVRNGLYIIIQEVDKVVTELASFSTIVEAEKELKKLTSETSEDS